MDCQCDGSFTHITKLLAGHGSPVPWYYFGCPGVTIHEVFTSTDLLNLPVVSEEKSGILSVSGHVVNTHTVLVCQPDMTSISLLGRKSIPGPQ